MKHILVPSSSWLCPRQRRAASGFAAHAVLPCTAVVSRGLADAQPRGMLFAKRRQLLQSESGKDAMEGDRFSSSRPGKAAKKTATTPKPTIIAVI
mmetsp:Transcript_1322/g.3742  ORF Transcript_1322/g.3742 Transcript_1322/m.3742 type:complete len:95 (-) Transcript_1322:745-1029(-)